MWVRRDKGQFREMNGIAYYGGRQGFSDGPESAQGGTEQYWSMIFKVRQCMEVYKSDFREMLNEESCVFAGIAIRAYSVHMTIGDTGKR